MTNKKEIKHFTLISHFFPCSVIYILDYFKETGLRPLQGLLPSKPVLLAYFFSFVVTSISEKFFCCSYGWFWRLVHMSIGAVCLLIVTSMIYLTETNLVQFLRKQLFYKLRRKVE